MKIGYKIIAIKRIYTENANVGSEKICVTGFTDDVQQLTKAFEERFQGNNYFEKYIVPLELYKPRYKNKLLRDMRERDKKEMRVMYQIINAENSQNRWKIIENYFLGNIVFE